MAVSASWYTNGPKNCVNGTVNWSDNSTTTIKVSLHTSAYVPNQDTHEFFSSVTNEITGTGYTAGGQAITSRTVAADATTNETRLDGADNSWASSTITARIAVIRKDTGTAATSPVLGWVDFGADVSSSNGTFTITWDATGILKITAA